MKLKSSVVTALLFLAVMSGAAEVVRAQGVSVIGYSGSSTKPKVMVDSVRSAGGDSIRAIIVRDFENSDRIIVVPPAGMPSAGGPMNYALLTQFEVNGVVVASLLPSGWLHVELHDVVAKLMKQKADFPLPGIPGNPAWRLALHGVADSLEAWITGTRGIAQTRIAFVRDGRVWLVDSDGANANPVTPRGLSPKWTPNGRALVYYINDAESSPVMITDLATGAQRALTSMRSSQAQDYDPVVTPDGRSIVFARSSDSGTDLFTVPLIGGSPQRLTSGRGRASGSASVSPDGQRMVFASDRSGHQEVYISDIDGTNVELLTTGGVGERNWRDNPDWSPDGRTIAYQSGIERGAFQIMTIDVRSQTTKQITSDGRNDDPSWAPDSRHMVITSTRGGTTQLWVVDAQSGKMRQITRGTGARGSAWSPRLTGTP